jgi:hypothetical protein
MARRDQGRPRPTQAIDPSPPDTLRNIVHYILAKQRMDLRKHDDPPARLTTIPKDASAVRTLITL